MKCPKCANEFVPSDPAEPAVCPECGVVPEKFRQAQKVKLDSIRSGVHPRQVARVQARSRWPVIALAILAPIALVGVVHNIFFRPSGIAGSPPPTIQCGSGKDAYVMSQLFVEDRLKSPGSAKFPGTADSAVVVDELAECVYQVTAYVDSENSFGAFLRTGYSARMMYMPETDKWQALDVALFE